MQGMLLVDKPAGWTSFDVVNYVRKIVAADEGKKPKNVKVGHTGTLDPFATGLLVLLIGKDYTRRAAEFSKLDKTYEATMLLGQTSTTGDPEGDMTTFTSNKPTEQPTKAEIETVMQHFTGEIEQVPPAFSAIKINGQRAYKLAREGKEVIIEPRKVTINHLELIKYDSPEVTFKADVTSGTYIRTLVEDIGKALGAGAYTSALRRIRVGDFSIQNAIVQSDLNPESIKQHLFL
jgi:tRNA pseudouridine55 synthase